MKLGVHLPLISLANRPWTLDELIQYTETAERLGFSALAQNDHFLYNRPWLDGPVALAAVLTATRRMDLFTTVFLPVLRGPVQSAKTLAALDILSPGAGCMSPSDRDPRPGITGDRCPVRRALAAVRRIGRRLTRPLRPRWQ